MAIYKLDVKVVHHWEHLCDIRASDRGDALRQAFGRLQPEHYDKPIRIERQTVAKPRPETKARRQPETRGNKGRPDDSGRPIAGS